MRIRISNCNDFDNKLTYHIVLCSAVTEHKVVIVGLNNAGKTTILYQL